MLTALYVIALLIFLYAVERASYSRRFRRDAAEYEALTDDERVAYHVKQFERSEVFDSKGKRTVATLMARTKQKPMMSDSELAALIEAMTMPVVGDKNNVKRGMQVSQAATVVLSYRFSPEQVAVLVPAIRSVYEGNTLLQMAKMFCFLMMEHLKSDALASEARACLRVGNLPVRRVAKSYLQSLRGKR